METKDLKYKNIVISGGIGTGKSTLARNLAKRLGWKVLSTGEYFRKWHEENGISLNESGKVPEGVDKKIDFGYQRMMRENNGIVFESHLGGWLASDIPTVFKVLCTAGLQVRMERVAARDGLNMEEAIKNADKRAEAHREKFERLYGVKDRFNPKYFNVSVDTTSLTPEEVLEQVLEKLVENDKIF